MEEQARSWVFGHIKTLHIVWKSHLMQVFGSGRVLSDTLGTVRVDHQAIHYLNRIHDLAWDADLYIRFRGDGLFFNVIDPRFADVGGAESQNEIYERIERDRVARANQDHARFLRERAEELAQQIPIPDFLQSMSACTNREWVHREMQPELENPPARKIEAWVNALQDPQTQKIGFVIYRLSHGGTDQEWVNVRRKLYAGLNSGWEGVVGVNEAIRLKAALHWVDGKDANLPANDLEAAKA